MHGGGGREGTFQRKMGRRKSSFRPEVRFLSTSRLSPCSGKPQLWSPVQWSLTRGGHSRGTLKPGLLKAQAPVLTCWQGWGGDECRSSVQMGAELYRTLFSPSRGLQRRPGPRPHLTLHRPRRVCGQYAPGTGIPAPAHLPARLPHLPLFCLSFPPVSGPLSRSSDSAPGG